MVDAGDPKGKPRGGVDGVFVVSKGETMGERRRWRENEVPGMVGDTELLEGIVEPLALAVAERPRLSATGDFVALPEAEAVQRGLERRLREDMQAEK